MKRFEILLFLYLTFLPIVSFAETLTMPVFGRNSVIGEIRSTSAGPEDTLIDIASRFDLGYDEIVQANPTLDRWVPGVGNRVVLPSKYILPNLPPGVKREGIVLNVGELRLYYFPPQQNDHEVVVMTFPVSIGRMDWSTPLGKTTVVKKEKDPAWYAPKSIKEEHAREGEILPDVIPGGRAENPLGHYALRLGVPGYLIHGTDEKKQNGIGMYVTHGCIRMYSDDIEWLYRVTPVGAPVYIVDQPVKLGWQEGTLYLEVHTPLEEESDTRTISEEEVLSRVQEVASGYADIDWEAVHRTMRIGNGVPVAVARTKNNLPPPLEIY